MSTIVKNIHIFKDGAWHPIKKVFKDSAWRTMKGIFYEGVWYEIGATCVVMPDGCAVSTTVHPRWNEDTTNYGTNNFGFNAIPGGIRRTNGPFSDIGTSGLWWSATERDTKYAWRQRMHYDNGNVNRDYSNKMYGFSVRCVKDYTGTQPNGTILTNDYTDGDGNTYDSVVIGKQLWTVENLYTTKYQNGTDIPNVTDEITWAGLTTGAYCGYNNDYESYGQYYGALYNWYAVDNGLVDNNGYRVPSDADWTQLTNYLINTNWCNGVVVTSNNVAQFLKSCRQVNHPLAPNTFITLGWSTSQDAIFKINDVTYYGNGDHWDNVQSYNFHYDYQIGDVIELLGIQTALFINNDCKINKFDSSPCLYTLTSSDVINIVVEIKEQPV